MIITIKIIKKTKVQIIDIKKIFILTLILLIIVNTLIVAAIFLNIIIILRAWEETLILKEKITK